MNNGIQPTVELATNNGNGFAYPVYPAMGGFGNSGFGGFGGDGAIWILLLIALFPACTAPSKIAVILSGSRVPLRLEMLSML